MKSFGRVTGEREVLVDGLGFRRLTTMEGQAVELGQVVLVSTSPGARDALLLDVEVRR